MRPEAEQLAELQAQVRQISAQVANFEQRLSALEAQRAAAPVPVAESPPTVPAPTKPRPERLESRFGVTFINRAGAVTLAIGIVFFFKYAVDNRWIGAAGRVVLGIVIGLTLVGAAEWLRKRNQQAFAQGVCGCGIAVLYTAFYAAFAYYQLFPEWLAFCGMIAACVLSVGLTFRYRSPALAALGIAGAFLAPMLLGRATDHPWLLFTYLLLVDIATLAIVWRKRWTILYALSFAGTVVLFVIWNATSAANIGTGVFFLCVFFVLLFSASIWLADREPASAATVLLPVNAAWVVFSAWSLLNRQYPGWFTILTLGLAAAHFVAAFSREHAPAVCNWLYVLAHACLLTALLRELEMWSVNNSAPLTRASVISESTSVLLAVYAIAVIALGVVRRASIDRTIGLVLLGIVIGKLYCYDVWQLTRFYRISAFVALGILLLAASYIYSRFREKFDVLWSGKNPEVGPPS